MEAIQELFQFLDINSRVDLKTVALENILGLTGSPDGIQLLTSSKSTIFPLLLKIASDDKSEALRKDASLALINFSANKDAATKMLDMGNDDLEKFIKGLWSLITKSIYPSADPAAMVLCNLTIEKVSCDKVYDCFKKNEISVQQIVDRLCVEEKVATTNEQNEEVKKPKLHYLGPFLSNLSQLSEVREELFANGCELFSRLLPFSEYSESTVRRGGVIGAIRNCCFDTSVHYMLLTKMDILPRLLLPLAGPTPEDMEEEDIEKLPIDLQYLDESKKPEQDADIRYALLHSVDIPGFFCYSDFT